MSHRPRKRAAAQGSVKSMIVLPASEPTPMDFKVFHFSFF
jgi:hypothetical protein